MNGAGARALALAVLTLTLATALGGCASVRTLDAAKPGAPLIYSGTRLDWYALGDGCCSEDHFGAAPPRHPGLDLPVSFLLDTLLLPLSIAAEFGVVLGVRGGL